MFAARPYDNKWAVTIPGPCCLSLHPVGWPCAGVVDVCLIPEARFDMHGDHGLLKYVQGLLDDRGHCVVCIAEGAAQVGAHLAHLQRIRPRLAAVV